MPFVRNAVDRVVFFVVELCKVVTDSADNSSLKQGRENIMYKSDSMSNLFDDFDLDIQKVTAGGDQVASTPPCSTVAQTHDTLCLCNPSDIGSCGTFCWIRADI